MAQTNVTVRKQLKTAVAQHKPLSKAGIQERLFANAFTKLVYAQIWEDPDVDMRALDIQPHHHIVCIASGGCNVMSYLTKTPASITALDLSPAHVALNKLKLVAAQHAPNYKTFYNMFGHANIHGNSQIYDAYFRHHLDEKTKNYWESRLGLSGRKIDMFEQGFYRFGLLGKFIRAAHILTSLFGINMSEFIECRTLDEQKRFYKNNVEPIFDKALVKWIANNRISLFGLGIPPQQYEDLAGAADGDILAVLKERTRALMCDFPLSENYFAWQAFNRGYNPQGAGPVPPYLQIDKFKTIRNHAKNVEVHNQSFTEFLKNTLAASKHAYVLLDAQDWMTDDQLNDLWAQITRTAASGAKVIYRTAGIETILPNRVKDTILNQWTYHKERSEELCKQDRSAIYGGFHLYEFKGG